MGILVDGDTSFTVRGVEGVLICQENGIGHAEFEVLVIHPEGVSCGQLDIRIWSRGQGAGVKNQTWESSWPVRSRRCGSG